MNENLPESLGVYYEESVPDTLDLADHARYGLNHFMLSSLEDLEYEMPFCIEFSYRRPPCMNAHFTDLACQAKAMEAIVYLRIISGSKEKIQHEKKMIEMMTSLLGEEGLWWLPVNINNKKPWLKNEPLAMVCGQGIMMRAMIAWYQYTKNEQWKTRIDKMVDGLDRIMVVHKDDYAYFPTLGYYNEEYFRSCYTKKGWKDITEPIDEKKGEEGSLFNHQGLIPQPLSIWYRLTGNKQALRLAGELVRFYLKPEFWADWKNGDYPFTIGEDHAHWAGHFHGHVNTLRAILEYAFMTNDVRLKQFVRDGYEWCRQSMLARIGYVGDGQGCGCARLIGLATKLSYYGIGDYWEDIDLYIRNHGVEAQFTPEDIPILKDISKQKPGPISICDEHGNDIYPPDAILHETASIAYEAVIGAFAMGMSSSGMGHVSKAQSALCCSTNGNMGIFYAWEGILRHLNGVAQVNLLLNRASPWMDIYSYLPYEGKIIIKNKTCREAFVRIPNWVDKSTIICRISDKVIHPSWFGSYMRFEYLKCEEIIIIEFKIEERTEKWKIPMRPKQWVDEGIDTYTLKFKGNTLVEILPEFLPGSMIYKGRLKLYNKDKASMKKTIQFATDFGLFW